MSDLDATPVAGIGRAVIEKGVVWNRELSRRLFLRRLAFGAGLVAAANLRAPAVLSAADRGSSGLRVLSPQNAEIMTAVAQRMVDSGNPQMPDFTDTDGIVIIDAALTLLPEDQQRELHWALWLFDYSPLAMIGRWGRFTALEDAAQDRCLEAWAHSSWQLCRLGFDAFKNLSMLGYYSQDATWAGIRYEGPWLPRPRRLPGAVVR